MSELFFSLVLGHFIADYWFQTKKMNNQKRSKDKKERNRGLFIHSLSHFIISLFALIFLPDKYINSFWAIILISLIITVIHYLIDLAKVTIQREEKYPTIDDSHKYSIFINNLITKTEYFVKESVLGKSFIYIFDQVLHISTIFFVLSIFNYLNYNIDGILSFIDKLLFNKHLNLSNLDKFLLITTLIIFTTHFSGYLVGILLTKIKPKETSYKDSRTETKKISKTKNNSKENSEGVKETEVETEEETSTEEIEIHNHFSEPDFEIGKYIGMLERIIIMILVALQAYAGITFLVALKAFTRSKQLDDKKFSEYYLIGSLISVLFGLISGYLLLQIIK